MLGVKQGQKLGRRREGRRQRRRRSVQRAHGQPRRGQTPFDCLAASRPSPPATAGKHPPTSPHTPPPAGESHASTPGTGTHPSRTVERPPLPPCTACSPRMASWLGYVAMPLAHASPPGPAPGKPRTRLTRETIPSPGSNAGAASGTPARPAWPRLVQGPALAPALAPGPEPCSHAPWRARMDLSPDTAARDMAPLLAGFKLPGDPPDGPLASKSAPRPSPCSHQAGKRGPGPRSSSRSFQHRVDPGVGGGDG